MDGKVNFERNELYIRGAIDVKDNAHEDTALLPEKVSICCFALPCDLAQEISHYDPPWSSDLTVI